MGETIRFKAINTFGEMYESVTANGKELTPDTDGMYSLTLEDTDYIINIPTTANISTEKQLYQQGETVKISGMVGSAANAEVEVRMTGDGVSQTLTAKTDAEGAFTAEWTPYDGQMGRFAIGVRYDGKDMVDEPALIDVIGLKRTNNGYITCEAVVGEPFTGEIEVVNPCGIAQRVKAVEVLSKPANCELTTEQPATIEAGSKAKVKYTLTGSAPTEGNDWELVQLRLTTEEGATIEATLYYYCHPAQAVLAANKSSISTTMVKGSSRDYPVIITNRGKGGTGKIQVSMPGLQWMTLVTPAEMSSLACGEQATIMLQLTPSDDMPLNIPQTGIIGVNCENGDGIAIGYSIEAVSDQTGTLTIDVVDEFSGDDASGPHLQGATVEVMHPTTGALITQGTTDGNGKCSLQLQEGYYRISVTAEKHSAYENYVLVDPGRETTQEVFLSYQTVTASWTMVETEIEDRYEITNTMTFETNVPKPVLVITLPDKKPIPSEVFPIILTNHGLINTENVSMTGYCTGGYELEILNIETLPVLGPETSHTYYAVIKGDAELWPSSCVTAWVVADGYYQCRGTQHVQASAYLYYCTQTGGSPSGGTGTWSGAVPPPPFGIGGYGTVTGGAAGGGTPRIQLSESVPAWVTLEIKQTMTMNRPAYQGTLTLENGYESMAVTGVGLNIIITDEEGKVATGQEFASVLENLSVFTGEAFLPGDWTLDARKTGTATVLFIPQPDAAPNGPKQYTFKGTLTFKDPFSAQQLTLPLTPFTFTVQPLPELELTYLMQRDIYGDDPLTKGVVEPMEPAEFALIINNKGNGEAKNVKIRTEQPKIVKNDQGLLIDFKIESASVNGETTNVTPQPDKSFVTDFGNIPAQSQSYAQWWLTSTLLGHFISYDVEAVHTTDYGGQNMSLISSVIIHEMVHGFTPTNNAGRGWIVNDEADEADLPDVVYFSDATKQPLHIATGKLERVSDLQYKLDISHAQSGWNYGSVNSTVGSGMKVAKVVRQSDGTELPVDNVWQTDRTLRDGRDWLYENRLHFVGDMTGDSETYLLTFAINDEQSIKDITSNGELTVRFDGERLYVFGGFNEIHGLSVYDLRGVKRVGVSNLTAGQGINVGGLKAGVYYIQVATDCGVYRAKAIKR